MSKPNTNMDCRMSRLNILKHGRQAAFTLIELLVVVAIIAILIAVLMPSLASARKQSQRVQCVARQRGIAGLLQTYSAENNAVIPVSQYTFSYKGYDRMMAWYSWLIGQSFDAAFKTDLSYVPPASAWKLFVCPAYYPERFPKDAINTNDMTLKAYYAYGMMYNLGSVAGVNTANWVLRDAGGVRVGQKMTMVDAPGQIPLLADSVRITSGNQWISFRPDDSSWVLDGTMGGIHLRHDDKANVLYYDGHADAMSAQAGRTIGLKCLVSTQMQVLP